MCPEQDIVFGAKSTTVSQAQKRETWDRISKNINIENPTTTLRPTVSVRKKWENLLGIAKKDIKTYKKSLAGRPSQIRSQSSMNQTFSVQARDLRRFT